MLNGVSGLLELAGGGRWSSGLHASPPPAPPCCPPWKSSRPRLGAGLGGSGPREPSPRAARAPDGAAGSRREGGRPGQGAGRARGRLLPQQRGEQSRTGPQEEGADAGAAATRSSSNPRPEPGRAARGSVSPVLFKGVRWLRGSGPRSWRQQLEEPRRGRRSRTARGGGEMGQLTIANKLALIEESSIICSGTSVSLSPSFSSLLSVLHSRSLHSLSPSSSLFSAPPSLSFAPLSLVLSFTLCLSNAGGSKLGSSLLAGLG